jgi:hypothetical protein
MKVSLVTRIAAGIVLYAFAMAIFLQAYFYFWKVVPALATLAEGMDLRFPSLVNFVLAPWPLLGWPVLLILPVLLGVGALPEKAFLRVSIIVGLVLVSTQVLMSCFFIYMQVLGQEWWVLALQKVGSNG